MRIQTRFPWPVVLTVVCLLACNKQVAEPAVKPGDSSFKEYIIRQGQQYCNDNAVTFTDYKEMKFTVRFDSSAIYTTIDPQNQEDINKLYGFSDNNKPHHEFSARIGWQWGDGTLRLFAYTYNNGTRSEKLIGNFSVGGTHACGIKVEGKKYIFSIDDRIVEMPRASTTTSALGYRLFPFFGGDETAPHDIHIWIRES